MARARKTSKHISDNKPMKKSVKVLHFRNAEASEQREFIRKRKRDEMETKCSIYASVKAYKFKSTYSAPPLNVERYTNSFESNTDFEMFAM